MKSIAKLLSNHGIDIIYIHTNFVMVLGDYCKNGKFFCDIQFIESIPQARDFLGY